METMLRRATLAGLLTLAALPLSAQSRGTAPANDPWAVLNRPNTRAATPTTGAITPTDLQSRLYQFAADSMRGRVIGDPGNVKGAEYIASEVRRLGLEPAGENGTYFQTLPLVTRSLDTTSTIIGNGHTYHAWADFVPRDQGPAARSFNGVVVVYGGDFADTQGRIKPEDAAGKFLILTYSGPAQGTNPAGIPNRFMVNNAYRGAAAIAIVGRDNITADQLKTYQGSQEVVLFDNIPAAPTYLYVTRAMAEGMLGNPIAGMRAGTAGYPSLGVVKWNNVPAPNPARNVVAILRGSDPKLRKSYVAIGAHNDHIGVGDPVAFDSQYVVNHHYRLQGADDRNPTLNAEQIANVNAILARVRATNGGASA
ncbi:MAG TPA: hypothetical protein VF454_03110, partial [Gemmatimonadales bacterium]